MMAAKHHILRVARNNCLGLAVATMLSACAVGPDFERPAPPTTDRYTVKPQIARTVEADEQTQRFLPGTGLPEDWWRMFKSEQLNEIVHTALANSPTLDAARARLSGSQNQLRAGYGVFFPRVDTALVGSRQRTAPITGNSTEPSTVFNLVTLTGSIGYTLDLFGGERRAVEGLAAQAHYQYYANQAAYVSLSANVVSTCIARAAYAAEIAATWDIIELETQQLDAATAQYESGTTPYTTVLAIRSQIASARIDLAGLQQKLDQSEHLLAQLEGSSPSEANLPKIELDQLSLPTDLPVSLPSQLVHLRPDILQAEEQLHGASANVGVATAAMFPSISLSGAYGIAGKSFGNLSPDTAKFWNVGPSLSLPLFQGGSLWYGRKAAIDAFHESEANYRQTVLAAFAQVADSLKAIEHDAQGLDAQVDMRRTAHASLRLVKINNQAGLAAYADVLAAEVQYQQQLIAYEQAVAIREQDTVALFMALGGGWWNHPAAATASIAP